MLFKGEVQIITAMLCKNRDVENVHQVTASKVRVREQPMKANGNGQRKGEGKASKAKAG